MQWIYLDNNATTQPAPEVVAALNEAAGELWANPSSVHRFGQMVRQRLELARNSVAKLINAKPRQIVFTSGGTESNNLALRGLLHEGDTLITTAIEHSAIREPAEFLQSQGVAVDRLPVAESGLVDPQDVAAAVAEHMAKSATVLVSIHWANNETGVIEPIEQIGQIIRDARVAARESGSKSRVYLHVDGTQAVGKIPVDVQAAGVDMLTLSSHKFHGPKGAGALYVGTGVRIRSQILGGPQEREKRGGTDNTLCVLPMGVAAELAGDFVQDREKIQQLTALRDRFEQGVIAALPSTRINSGQPGTPRLWNTTNLAFPGLEAEAILLGLSERGVCASAGAACSSGSLEPSPVLRAMGIDEPAAHGSVRFSLSRFTQKAEIDQAIDIVAEVVGKLGKTLPTA